jgi:hypothetical protein
LTYLPDHFRFKATCHGIGLLSIAQACSLVYSFEGEKDVGADAASLADVRGRGAPRFSVFAGDGLISVSTLFPPVEARVPRNLWS